ncbi:hypothetical protein HNR23_003717 [Nocardiopsis mwathae]|uniref:Uncharacterized protein n=1 Tax=Nocardiopsis mwathae TaxID=1472723 RepID=A0A7X0D6K9_9ACTN|nr:hypothetical protein [Nocardiopsis mwathae]
MVGTLLRHVGPPADPAGGPTTQLAVASSRRM